MSVEENVLVEILSRCTKALVESTAAINALITVVNKLTDTLSKAVEKIEESKP